MAGSGIKVALVAAAALGVGGFLFFQQKQIRQARAQNEQLRAQLQAAEQQAIEAAARPAPVQTNTPSGPDPELLRLRAEVARLRALEAELARTRQQLAQAKAAPVAPAVQPVQPPPVADAAAAAQHQELVIRTVNGMKQLGLGINLLARDQTAADKSIIQNGQLNPTLAQSLKTAENSPGIDLSQIELLVTDAGQLHNAAPETIVARTKPIATPDGKWLRVYTRWDGSAQQILHRNPNDVWDGQSVVP
jgi:hypothetical protein